MRKFILLATLVMLLVPGVALAQGPINPQSSDPTWTAEYYDNVTLTGVPVLTRQERAIDHDWGTGSPALEVPTDRFSARWRRYLYLTAGSYRFRVSSDDGVRLWIDGELLVDEWYDHAVQTFTVDKYLETGHHMVQLDYYENTGFAEVALDWFKSGQAQRGWHAEYFNNLTLSGPPALVRNETDVGDNWGTGSPAPGIVGDDTFSAIWTQTRNFTEGTYRFSVTSDDGVRLWVNDVLLIDAWRDQAATTYNASIYLPGGPTPIEVQYYERTDRAQLSLSWSEVTGPPDRPPTQVTVDNGDTGFLRGGTEADWSVEPEGINDDLLWTRNNDVIRSNYNWARWIPDLAAGTYEVFVYIPFNFSTTSQARYWVRHSGEYALRVVDQSVNGAEWVSLGTYEFLGDGTEYVSLADVTFEAYESRLVAFDAVRFEAR
ncbi:MAG: PA14 domain-containing protein [Anaerolineae bacterium]